MKRRTIITLSCLAAFLALIWLNNTSLLSRGDGEPFFIAHRGLAPVMNPEHEDLFACLGRIYPPEHDYIENTIPSIEAAFNFGASFCCSLDS